MPQQLIHLLLTVNSSLFVRLLPQAQALPIIMSGRDCIGVAKTGSGKTLAFVLPMLRHIKDQPPLAQVCACQARCWMSRSAVTLVTFLARTSFDGANSALTQQVRPTQTSAPKP